MPVIGMVLWGGCFVEATWPDPSTFAPIPAPPAPSTVGGCTPPGVDEPPFSIASDLALQDQLDIAADADGRGMWMVWREVGIGSRLRFGHVTCSGIMDIGPDYVDIDGMYQGSPHVAVDETQVVITWRDDDEHDEARRIFDLDGEILSPSLHGDGDERPTSLALGPSGGWIGAEVFFGFSRTVRLIPFDRVGNRGVPVNLGAGDRPQVAVDADGEPVAVWAVEGDLIGIFDAGTVALADITGTEPTITWTPQGAWLGWIEGDLPWIRRPGDLPGLVDVDAAASPVLASTDDGGVRLSWFVLGSEDDHEIRTAWVDAAGEVVDTHTVSVASDLSTPPAVAELIDGWFFVGWTAADGQITGRFTLRRER